MKVVLVIAAFCVAVCLGQNSTDSEVRSKRQTKGRFLSFPVPQKCASRPRQFQYGGRYYFLSNARVDWLDARNLCREYCMDAVSLETEHKNNYINNLIRAYNVPYIWTSGRLCDFKGCAGRAYLEPRQYHGWFWSANQQRIAPTYRIPPGFRYNPWSQTGHKRSPQPDNAEFDINQTIESCLSILNNVYNDGINWHDVACYHKKPVICEDSPELLNYVAYTNPSLRFYL
ncbi:uncharacterized protein LOC116339567 [Contarinia nasturtii]|uniref:uncharacterized protein LOC116339567 n=1 Tax=Contarinia nasturtii TaxID=265458 RepID=UPI0012D43229|nr:uncharacterized protein LOC116339567 [Contarinia nasturtii]